MTFYCALEGFNPDVGDVPKCLSQCATCIDEDKENPFNSESYKQSERRKETALNSETPRTDAEVAKIESELGDGPPCISPAAIDVAVRLRLTSFARQLESDLTVYSRDVSDLLEKVELQKKLLCEAREWLCGYDQSTDRDLLLDRIDEATDAKLHD